MDEFIGSTVMLKCDNCNCLQEHELELSLDGCDEMDDYGTFMVDCENTVECTKCKNSICIESKVNFSLSDSEVSEIHYVEHEIDGAKELVYKK